MHKNFLNPSLLTFQTTVISSYTPCPTSHKAYTYPISYHPNRHSPILISRSAPRQRVAVASTNRSTPRGNDITHRNKSSLARRHIPIESRDKKKRKKEERLLLLCALYLLPLKSIHTRAHTLSIMIARCNSFASRTRTQTRLIILIRSSRELQNHFYLPVCLSRLFKRNRTSSAKSRCENKRSRNRAATERYRCGVC